jgi:hypothetical protein
MSGARDTLSILKALADALLLSDAISWWLRRAGPLGRPGIALQLQVGLPQPVQLHRCLRCGVI